jgi:hypothetical protein
MKKDVLTRPFAPEQVRTRPGQGGKSLSYVETHAVIARLNEASEYEWSFEIARHEVLADEVIVLGKLTIDGVTKMAFGGSTVTRDNSGKEVSLADDLKAATSDAIKKTATLFGIGLELYGGAPARQAPQTEEERRGPQVDDRLTSRQLAALQSACRRKGLSGNHLTALVGERYGKNNPQMLTRSEASNLISALTGTNGGRTQLGEAT